MADTIFYIKERSSSPSFLIEAKRQSSASSGQVTFSGKVVSMVILCVSQQLLQYEECLVNRVWPKEAMIATLHDQPNFSELFMADLLSRDIRIEEDLIDQLFNSSEKRLAAANFGKESAPHIIREVQSRTPRRDDRHDSITGQPFHEQVPAN